MRTPILATFLLVAATTARAGEIRLAGDSSSWQVAGDETSGGVRTLELLRPGRSFGNSPEILTVVRGPGKDASTAAERYLSEKKLSCDEGHYELVRSGWEDTIYRWDSRGCDAPETELDEVGRVVVSGGDVVRISLRLRDPGRLSFWNGWISSSNAAYRSWRGSVYAEGGRQPAAGVEAPSPDACADDDLSCLLAVQRGQLAALEATRVGGSSTSRTSSAARAGASARPQPDSGSGCCSVSEIRGLQMQRGNPNSGRTEDVTRFLSTDTYIYVVADLRGNQGGSTVTFRWVRVDGNGQEHEATSRDISIASGNKWVYGSFFHNGLTPTGRYRVHVYFDGVHAGSRDFQVVAGSAFG